MTIPDKVGYTVLTAILWLNPLVYVVGLAISVWAGWVTRKAGYLLVAAYFLLVMVNLAVPAIRVMSGPPQPQFTKQQIQEYGREINAVDKRYFPSGHPVVRPIPFPLGPILLVTGIWIVAKRDVRRRPGQTDPSVPGPSGSPVTGIFRRRNTVLPPDNDARPPVQD